MKNGRIRVLKVCWGLILFSESNVTYSVDFMFAKGYLRLPSLVIWIHPCDHFLLCQLGSKHNFLKMIVLNRTGRGQRAVILIPGSVFYTQRRLPFKVKWLRIGWWSDAFLVFHHTLLPCWLLELVISSGSSTWDAWPSFVVCIISFLIIIWRLWSYSWGKKSLTMLIFLDRSFLGAAKDLTSARIKGGSELFSISS